MTKTEKLEHDLTLVILKFGIQVSITPYGSKWMAAAYTPQKTSFALRCTEFHNQFPFAVANTQDEALERLTKMLNEEITEMGSLKLSF